MTAASSSSSSSSQSAARIRTAAAPPRPAAPRRRASAATASSAASAASAARVVPAAAGVADDLSSRVQDFDGRYGNGEQEPVPERLLAALDPSERASVLLFHRASPSVVNISTTAGAGPLFPLNMMQVPAGVGSGFVWDRAGPHVVTNAHVVAGASTVKVTLYDGSSHDATVVGTDRERDVAVLRLSGMERRKAALLRPLDVGCSSDLLVGQKVFAIGNPFGLDQSMSSGIVSGLGRALPTSPTGLPITNCIQLDAAINPGNSGGPLLASSGKVVGINTAIYSPSGASAGVGFAIPIDAAAGVVRQILEFGRVVRPYLGLALAPPALGRRAGASGAVVLDVAPGGPAAAAGVRGASRELLGVRLGDAVTSLNGRPVKTERDLFSALDECRPGDSVPVTVRGDGGRGAERRLTVKLAERTVATGGRG